MSETKMVKYEEPEYISSHKHTKTAPTYKAALWEWEED